MVVGDGVGALSLPAVLFVLFALLSAAGAYWIAAHFRSWRLALPLALAVLAFFVLLALAVEALFRGSGLS